MVNKPTIISVIIFAVAVTGVVIFGLVQEKAKGASDGSPAEIFISPASYNFGEVSQKAGVVSASFTVKNTGTGELVIDQMLSSCACTSASLIVDGQEGPRFGMHNNPKFWSAKIEPGESAELKVYYDPNVHPDFRGAATREITVFSNATNKSQSQVRITLNQTD